MIRTSSIAGSLLLIVAALAWGAMFPVAQSALAAIDAFHLTLFRYGFGAVIFAAILVAVPRSHPHICNHRLGAAEYRAHEP